MTLAELLQQIVSLNPAPKEFADALKQSAQPLFQEVFNRGHSTAAQDDRTKLTELEQKVQTLESERTNLTQQIETLKSEKPDVARITSEFEAKIAEANTRADQARKEARDMVARAHEDIAVAQLRSKLAGKLVPEYADVVAERHREWAGRLFRERRTARPEFRNSDRAVESQDAGPEKWSRRESNPRPRMDPSARLRACSALQCLIRSSARGRPLPDQRRWFSSVRDGAAHTDQPDLSLPPGPPRAGSIRRQVRKV